MAHAPIQVPQQRVHHLIEAGWASQETFGGPAPRPLAVAWDSVSREPLRLLFQGNVEESRVQSQFGEPLSARVLDFPEGLIDRWDIVCARRGGLVEVSEIHCYPDPRVLAIGHNEDWTIVRTVDLLYDPCIHPCQRLFLDGREVLRWDLVLRPKDRVVVLQSYGLLSEGAVPHVILSGAEHVHVLKEQIEDVASILPRYPGPYGSLQFSLDFFDLRRREFSLDSRLRGIQFAEQLGFVSELSREFVHPCHYFAFPDVPSLISRVGDGRAEAPFPVRGDHGD